MTLTDYHAKYYAWELTRRCPSDSVDKLAGAQVDPAPVWLAKQFTAV